MVTWENYEEYMLLDADGELNETEQVCLQAFIALHPELQKEQELYSAVRFAPDTTQLYQQKDLLLKEEPQKKTIAFKGWWAYGAAAGIAAIIGIWALKQPAQQPLVVDNTPAKVAPLVAVASEVKEPKDIHSSPVKTVTVENTIKRQPAAIVQTKKKNNEVPANTQKVIQPVTEPKVVTPQPETIAQASKEMEKTFRLQDPEPKTNTQPEVLPVEPIVTEPNTVELKTRRSGIDVLALLDVKESQGVADVKDAISAKLEQAKDIKNKIKGTDVSLRIGKKELFVLKF
ncbi:MAG: hypothetical protein EOP56_01135 [Sphingobacteriales bacterium]|nr:MAG: hypothetical protein EOP56_01135 [Sphingobacteriales bacterium]